MRLNFVISILLIMAMQSVQASGGGESYAAATNNKWMAECGACHVAYPARMLPAASWRGVMGGLNKHFGTDASVDPATGAEILAFLEKNASKRKTEPSGKPLLRITETRWFQSEHDEVPSRIWNDSRVKNASNCAACHTKAESGDFNEHNIRLPKS